MNIIAVLGGKGGTGKSTCSTELAIALAKKKRRVLLVDTDAGMRCLDMLLGVSEKLLFDLSDAMSGKDLDSCLLDANDYGDIKLLAAPAGDSALDEEAFANFVRGLDDEQFDCAVFDLAAGINPKLYKAFPPNCQFVCVCNPNPISVRDAAAVGKSLNEAGRRGKILVNRFSRYFIPNPVFSNLDDIIDQTGMPLIGIVPESELLSLAFCNGKFPKKGREFKAFYRIASRLCGENIRLPKLSKI